MGLFKEKVSFNDFIILVYQFGFSFFNSFKNYFETNKIIVNETILFIVLETTFSTLFARELKDKTEIVEKVNRIVIEAFTEENKDDAILYFVNIREEIHDLIYNHIYIKDLVDYILSEIIDNQNIGIDVIAPLCDVLGEASNEIKRIVSNIKII